MALTVGELIAERYRLIRRIAVGGMGEVWEASDTRLARRVAIKVLKAELSGSPEFLQRFRIEARTTASLNHPGVAAVHDYGETSAEPGGPADTAYLVMELVEGEPLAAMIARRRRLTPERTLDVLAQAGNALHAAHQRGLVHRDVKPGNILLTATGAVKITDFGIAKAVDAAPVTRSGMVMGTAHYIAPEQAAGPASDVYSLGVVGYECLAGHRPFRSDSAVTVAMMHIRDVPPPLPPDTPPAVRALIEATLVKDPRARYGTGGEFAAAAAAVRSGRPLPRPGSAALHVPPHRGLRVPGVPPPAGHGPADDPPTGPEPRYAGHLPPTALAVGPPTPNPPGSGPFVRPPMPGPGPLPGQPLPGQPPTGQPTGPVQPRAGPGRRQGGRQRRRPPAAGARPATWLLAGLLLVAVLMIIVWVLVGVLGNDADKRGNRGGGQGVPSSAPQASSPPQAQPQPTGPEPTQSPTTPQNVTVNANDYRDQSAAIAVADLIGRGLRPEVVDEDGQQPQQPTTCLVTDVSPTGAVPLGTSVTVTCRRESG
jgi:eukaryotic-like serine/threonine-protein kinase